MSKIQVSKNPRKLKLYQTNPKSMFSVTAKQWLFGTDFRKLKYLLRYLKEHDV